MRVNSRPMVLYINTARTAKVTWTIFRTASPGEDHGPKNGLAVLDLGKVFVELGGQVCEDPVELRIASVAQVLAAELQGAVLDAMQQDGAEEQEAKVVLELQRGEFAAGAVCEACLPHGHGELPAPLADLFLRRRGRGLCLHRPVNRCMQMYVEASDRRLSLLKINQLHGRWGQGFLNVVRRAVLSSM